MQYSVSLVYTYIICIVCIETGVAVSENTTDKWHLNGNHLVIENLNRKVDNGDYECSAINETGGLIRATPEAIQLEIICKYFTTRILGL